MKVLIIGGVAAGTKVAAKLKREDRSIDVTILTKGKDISYAGCGLPYYVGKVIPNKEQLIVNTPAAFSKLTGATVVTGMEVTGVSPEDKTVTATCVETGETSVHSYDKLVIATGASPVCPNLPGMDLKHVYTMRVPDDAISLREAVEAGEIKRAVVVGAGFIGLEVAENLAVQGVRTTVLDFAPHVLANLLDPEVSDYVEIKMAEKGIMPMMGVGLEGILGTDKVEKVQTTKRALKADAVVLAMGIRPNTAFLEGTGIELDRGVVVTDSNLQTTVADIYAVGDCAYVTNRQTDGKAWSPMGSTANIAGRILAKNLVDNQQNYGGVLGTGVAKLPGDINVGRTGLTETAAVAAGYDVVSVCGVVDDKAHYYPDASSMIIKLIADKTTRKLLGVQAMGAGAVDKVTDIVVTGISLGATIDQMANLDFAYAPPFSTAIHPFSHMLNVLNNKTNGELETVTPKEFLENGVGDYQVLDVSLQPAIKGAPYIDLSAIEGVLPEQDVDGKYLLVCAKGKRAYMAQNRLKFYGYKNTRVLEGGLTFNEVSLED